jgi:hypothetical protein
MAEDQKPVEPAAENTAEPQPTPHHKPDPNLGQSRLQRFKTWYTGNKKLSIPATILLLVIILAAVPISRYAVAGTVVKKDLTIKVLDSGFHTPVSGAMVILGSHTAQTDSNGQATLHKVKAGRYSLTISKKYYQDKTINVSSPVIGKPNLPDTQIVATGRQVKVTVTNLVNKSVLDNVSIKVAGTTAKTDQTGTALIVLPAGIAEQKALLSADGYNDATVTIKVSNDQVVNNNLAMTPSGKVYFLSKLSGKIDVVKTNLDGTGRQTILAGTGKEDDRNTVLLASRDWKYLALLSRRAGTNASLYLINTADDSNTVMDSGSADFNLVGWSGNNFIYTVNHTDIQLWQAGRQSLKSYNAPAKKVQLLDQTTATGTSSSDYVTEQLGSVYAYEDQIYYDKDWQGAYYAGSLQNKQATFNSVKPDGSGKKAIKSFAPAEGTYNTYLSIDERVKSPDVIALHFYDGAKDNYYIYTNGQVKDDPQGSSDTFFSAAYPTYLQSPSGSKTFWSEPRDGKNTLFIGDENGQSSKQIASLSDYNTYGWFTDDYLLVSKNSSELYILDNNAKQTAVKISDYHKPALTFPGYGGGYGGF